MHDIHLHIQNAYTADALEGKLLFFPAGIQSVEELGNIFREYAEANPDLEVLFAENLPYTLFPNNQPTKAFIDAIVDDRPVYMLSETQHEGLMNSMALEAEGITADTPSPPKGSDLQGCRDRGAHGLRQRGGERSLYLDALSRSRSRQASRWPPGHACLHELRRPDDGHAVACEGGRCGRRQVPGGAGRAHNAFRAVLDLARPDGTHALGGTARSDRESRPIQFPISCPSTA